MFFLIWAVLVLVYVTASGHCLLQWIWPLAACFSESQYSDIYQVETSCQFLFIKSWSIWLMVVPFGDYWVTLYMFLWWKNGPSYYTVAVQTKRWKLVPILYSVTTAALKVRVFLHTLVLRDSQYGMVVSCRNCIYPFLSKILPSHNCNRVS